MLQFDIRMPILLQITAALVGDEGNNTVHTASFDERVQLVSYFMVLSLSGRFRAGS